jgi:hypothetical protein
MKKEIFYTTAANITNDIIILMKNNRLCYNASSVIVTFIYNGRIKSLVYFGLRIFYSKHRINVLISFENIQI